MRYLDTSVLVALYLPEPMNSKVQKLCSGSDTVAISGLSEIEFYSALARRIRMNELTKDDALKVLSLFKAHVGGSFYRMIAIEQRDYMLARDWLATFHTPLRTLDALHLAIAFSNGLTVATADKVFAASARHFDVKHELIS
ncbi:MAG: type II toxin-antitoxin system VapC family toxin [Candidatus Brocadiia bacterium]|jgi:predicted nucleic acid-binding protein